jgi:DNA polymerase (family X)
VAERSENLEVARLFEEIARSLEVKGEHGHRPRAYRRAARGVAGYPESLAVLAAEGRLRDVPGVGASLEALIAEYLQTGTMRTHARLVAEHPPGLAPLLEARGFGPAGVRSLYASLGVTDLDAVEQAAREGRLADAIGQKRAADLVAQFAALRNPIRRMRLKPAWEIAAEFMALLDEPSVRPRRLEVAGQARRMCAIVESGLDLVALVDAESAAQRLLERIGVLPSVETVVKRSSTDALVRTYDGLEVRLYCAPAASWGAALIWHTGSSAHLARLQAHAEARGVRFTPQGLSRAGQLLNGDSEETVYAALDLPWIAPELREDSGEIEAALNGRLPRLVTALDLKGDLHCHTHWTDGTASLEDMAAAARARGYAYMALTDHSRSLTITNGLSLERLDEARRQVLQLNHQLAPFTVLLGTEMDILEDGRLDYPDDVLATLDYLGVRPRSLQTVRAGYDPAHPARNHPPVGAHVESSPWTPARNSSGVRRRYAACDRHGRRGGLCARGECRSGADGPRRRLGTSRPRGWRAVHDQL